MIPQRIKIGGHTFDVKLVESIALRDECYGKMWLDKLEIHIDNSISESLQIETLYHEALHAISELNGLDLEENQVQCIAHGMFQVVKDNEI